MKYLLYLLFSTIIFLIGCKVPAFPTKIDNFPKKSFIKEINIYKIEKNDAYGGLFKHYKSKPTVSIKNIEIVHNIYNFILDSYACCTTPTKKEDSNPKMIVRITGDIKHKNVVLRIYQDYYDLSVNPSPKLIIAPKFKFVGNQSEKLIEMLGLSNKI